ncbi:APOPT family protein CG14806, mitochondrial [Gryllus bimaculatus]|nr:APOPT family protein CG14806, mitochondrial [Gryllus bimaculatus]
MAQTRERIWRMSLTSDSKVPKAMNHDVIGPPDKISNLRPVIVHIPKEESSIEKQFRLKREEIQKWNETFWSNHNTKFFEQKEKFTANHAKKYSSESSVSPMTSDEMSVFYKKFLDENWKTHQMYNVEWYRKNIGLLLLALRVTVFKVARTWKIISKL